MNYALIENGIVTNIIWLHPKNASDFPNAVPCNNVPVAIGDTYEDGVFYRDGKKVLTVQEQMQQEVADMQEALEYLGVTVDE